MTAEAQAAADAAAKKTADDAKAVTDAAAKKASDEAAARPGIEGMTPEKLQALYKQSPELFKGVVPEPVKEEKKIEAPPKQSAAPTLGDVEIKLPADVPVDRAALDARLALAKEVGLTPAQFQRQLDHEVALAREFYAKQPKVQTPAEQDAANVAVLKKDFGADYEANMATARGTFDKIKGRHPDLEAKLKTSDPAYVKLLLELGNADKDDVTPIRGDPRNGEETANAEKVAADSLKLRYPNSPQLFT